MESKFWYSGNYGVELCLTLDEANMGSHRGECDDDVAELSCIPHIKDQLKKICPERLKRELSAYGAWNEKELSDHAQNLQRILWLACGDVVEQQFLDDDE